MGGKERSKWEMTEVRMRGGKSSIPALTVEAGEVSPVEQGAVEGRQGHIEEQISAVGRVSDGVGEQVHLQQCLDQIAQHLAVQRDLQSLFAVTVTHSISPFKSSSPSTADSSLPPHVLLGRVKKMSFGSQVD